MKNLVLWILSIFSIPSVVFSANWWFNADFLYTKAKEFRLQYVTEAYDVSTSVVTDTSKLSFISPKSKWKCGYRLEFGHQWENWSLFLTFTDMNGEANGKVSSLNGMGFFPVWQMNQGLVFAQDYVCQATSHWSLYIHTIDCASKWLAYKHSSWFLLQSKLALRFGWINQRFQMNYSEGVFLSGTDMVRMRLDNWGLGPLMSINPTFFLGEHWSILGALEFTPFVTYFKEHQQEQYLNTQSFDKKDQFWKMRWILDVFAALALKEHFSNVDFSLRVGYEFHEYYKENMLSQSYLHLLDGVSQNLFVSGIFISARFDF
jgi:hypothetical protein